MQLFYGLPSPYSRKVRVAALELGVDMELISTNAMSDDPGLGRLNPVNRVPTLLLESGEALFDSPVICEYLDAHYGPRLFPASGPARWAALLRQALGDGLMDAAVPRRHESLRPVEQQSPGRLGLYKRSSDQIVARIESIVEQLPEIDIGTISIACGLAYLDFRFAGDNWRAGNPRLAGWLDNFSRRASMVATQYA